MRGHESETRAEAGWHLGEIRRLRQDLRCAGRTSKAMKNITHFFFQYLAVMFVFASVLACMVAPFAVVVLWGIK